MRNTADYTMINKESHVAIRDFFVRPKEACMKYTEENINKLEYVFKIMINLQDIKDTTVKQSKLHQVCQLLYEVGMVDNPKDTDKAIEIYSKYLLNDIRKIVQKSQ